MKREASQKDDNKNVHYDPTKLKLYLGNDPVILNEALTIIKKELLSAKDSISAACEVQDTTSANALGHKLYGTATSAGMGKLAELASRLERFDQNGKTDIQELGAELNQEIGVVLSLISS